MNSFRLCAYLVCVCPYIEHTDLPDYGRFAKFLIVLNVPLLFKLPFTHQDMLPRYIRIGYCCSIGYIQATFACNVCASNRLCLAHRLISTNATGPVPSIVGNLKFQPKTNHAQFRHYAVDFRSLPIITVAIQVQTLNNSNSSATQATQRNNLLNVVASCFVLNFCIVQKLTAFITGFLSTN